MCKFIPVHMKNKICYQSTSHLTIEGIGESTSTKNGSRSGGVKEKVQKQQPWRTN